MKIVRVVANNRKKAFVVSTEHAEYVFPYAKLSLMPTSDDRVVDAFPDPDAGDEAFTYSLESGKDDTVHIDAVLDYNRDPAYLNEIIVHRLTLEAQTAVADSDLSKREIIRRLGTSASQFYRLLDPTCSNKSIGQLLALLRLLERDVDLVVRPIRKGQSRRKRSIPA